MLVIWQINFSLSLSLVILWLCRLLIEATLSGLSEPGMSRQLCSTSFCIFVFSSYKKLLMTTMNAYLAWQAGVSRRTAALFNAVSVDSLTFCRHRLLQWRVIDPVSRRTYTQPITTQRLYCTVSAISNMSENSSARQAGLMKLARWAGQIAATLDHYSHHHHISSSYIRLIQLT